MANEKRLLIRQYKAPVMKLRDMGYSLTGALRIPSEALTTQPKNERKP